MRNRKGNAVSGAVVLRRAHRDQGKMKIRVYLIRHGKTAGNLKQAYIGSTDQPLCPQGRAELEALAGRLPIPDELWRSPLCRCGQTAGILYPGVPARVCADLRECDFGRYEGKNYDQLKDEAAYQEWLDSGGTIPFPDGEDPMVFRARSREAFAAIAASVAKRHPGGTLAIVCHGGTIWRPGGFFRSAPGFLRLAGAKRRRLSFLV